MKKETIRIRAEVAWRVFDSPGSGRWVADCPQLSLIAEGETFADLLETMRQALDLLFEDLIEEGDFNEFLSGRGWSLEKAPAPGKKFRVDIPFSWHRASHSDAEALACR